MVRGGDEIQRRVGRGVRKPRATAEPGRFQRPECHPDGYRSDSTGIFYKFPSQRSSGSGHDALRLPHPSDTPGAWNLHPVPQMPAAFAHHAPRASGFLCFGNGWVQNDSTRIPDSKQMESLSVRSYSLFGFGICIRHCKRKG